MLFGYWLAQGAVESIVKARRHLVVVRRGRDSIIIPGTESVPLPAGAGLPTNRVCINRTATQLWNEEALATDVRS